jgi:hypothetical protein
MNQALRARLNMIASRDPRTHHVYQALTAITENKPRSKMEDQTVANREDTDAENPNGFKFSPVLLRTGVERRI